MPVQQDVIIIGGGHNGLAAASYLGQRGLSVCILERTARVGGAAVSTKRFQGVDVRLSEFAYLLSLFPRKIIDDLGLDVVAQRRETASYTPHGASALLVSNVSADVTRRSFELFTGSTNEYENFQRFYAMTGELAKLLWPEMLSPLKSRQQLEASLKTEAQKRAWDWLVYRPVGEAIESFLTNDTVRGVTFTDAKIGSFTHAHDPTGVQNRTFAYHVIGNETGEWQVPVGGMGQVSDALRNCALQHGVDIRTRAKVTKVETDGKEATVTYHDGDREHQSECRYVLSNIARGQLFALLGMPCEANASQGSTEGAVFKINMVLRQLPQLKNKQYSPEDAFRGTFHLNEGYANLEQNYWETVAGAIPLKPGGEMYCHSLTDPSIVGSELREQGYHTLTLFGLDAPYSLFVRDPEGQKTLMTQRYLDGISEHLVGRIEDYLAPDANGSPSIDAKSPIDLENELGLPKGNFYHGGLQWPFAEHEHEVGAWGVETGIDNIFICGSSARRGGGVSSIAGHNAAMKVFECEARKK